jgi:hypothetical protein
MKPPAKILWLMATVMAVLWAIIASFLPALLVLAFGRGFSPVRYWAILLIQAVVVALVCASAYREGWQRGRADQTRLQAGEREKRSAA